MVYMKMIVDFQGSQSDNLIAEKFVLRNPYLFYFTDELSKICSNCLIYFYTYDTVIYISNSDMQQS